MLIQLFTIQSKRKELCKQVKRDGEESKVAIRNIRRDTLEALKKMKTAKEITEDEFDGWEEDVDKATAKSVEAIDKLMAEKEKDILTV